MNSVSLNVDVSVQSVPVESCNEEFHQRAQCSSMKAPNVLVLWISLKFYCQHETSVSKMNKNFKLKFKIVITSPTSQSLVTWSAFHWRQDWQGLFLEKRQQGSAQLQAESCQVSE